MNIKEIRKSIIDKVRKEKKKVLLQVYEFLGCERVGGMDGHPHDAQVYDPLMVTVFDLWFANCGEYWQDPHRGAELNALFQHVCDRFLDYDEGFAQVNGRRSLRQFMIGIAGDTSIHSPLKLSALVNKFNDIAPRTEVRRLFNALRPAHPLPVSFTETVEY